MIFNSGVSESSSGSQKFLIDDSSVAFSNLPESAAGGEFLTHTTRDPYEVGLVVTTESGKSVPVSNSGRTWTFVMPSENVVVVFS